MEAAEKKTDAVREAADAIKKADKEDSPRKAADRANKQNQKEVRHRAKIEENRSHTKQKMKKSSKHLRYGTIWNDMERYGTIHTPLRP